MGLGLARLAGARQSAQPAAQWSVVSPLRFCEAAMLEEGVSDHRHERMTVKALPRSSLEVVEAEFLFQLLIGLLAAQPGSIQKITVDATGFLIAE
jgi:hypothetical protein